MNRFVTPHNSDFLFPAGISEAEPSAPSVTAMSTTEKAAGIEAFSNGLTPSEAERLALLAEECGEVIQAIGKVLRHGYDSRHPNGTATNRHTLEREIGDLRACVALMLRGCDLRSEAISEAHSEKWRRLRLWTHHQGAML